MRRRALTPLASCVAVTGLVTATVRPQDLPTAGQRRVCTIGSIEDGAAPRIDGWLTDPCWAGAAPIGELSQLEPIEGAAPTHRTVVRILHDRVALYLAIECFDDQPDTIRATQRARDANLDPDDRVEWILDTFASRRNAYWFQIGAAGSRGDALIADNGSGFTKSWDCIWDGHAHITAKGWQAEVVIPFQSLAFAAGSTEWGFNLRREFRSHNETDQWDNINQGSSFFRIGDCGTLTGFGERRAGLGLDLAPFVAATGTRARNMPTESSSDLDAGLDLTWRFRPGLTLSATTFTDFAETEVDDRKINLTRFPLFFPEKRSFFLASASRFDFGPRTNNSRLLPFFSRRIGLDGDGNEIPILLGLKVAGQEGPWEIGALDVELDRNPDSPGARNLSVVRINRQLGQQSALGVILTHGNPTDDAENSVFGADWTHRIPDLFGGDLLLSAYAMQSFTEGPGGDGGAFGVDISGRTPRLSYDLGGRRIDDEFNPALGFSRRHGVWQQYSSLFWSPRPGGDLIRNFKVGGSTSTDFLLDGEADELAFSFTPLGIEFESDDEIRFLVSRKYALITEPFEIVDGLSVPIGEYWTNTFDIDAETSAGRPLTLEARYRWGELYDGTEQAWNLGFTWRTGPFLQLGAEYEETRGELLAGNFTTRVGETRVDMHFSPDLAWRNLVQYDTESRNLGVQSRVRWTLTPGSDLFVVLGSGWTRTDNDSLRPENLQGTLKFVWTFRF